MFPCLQTCASLLAQCIATKDLNLGKALHSHFIKTSLFCNAFISNRLVEFYSKCNSIECAQKAFDDLPDKSRHSWNALVSGYAKNGLFKLAHQLLDEMPEPDVVGYNSVISGLSRHGFYKESLDLFKKMQNMYSELFLDEYTIVSAVSSCGLLGSVRLLGQLHGIVIVLGLQFDVVVCNALLDAYGKCGLPDSSYAIFGRMIERDVVSWTSMVAVFSRASRLEDAIRIFHQMPVKNTVSWTALVAGLSQGGRGMEGLDLFNQMQKNGVLPNTFTYVAVLGACADLALIEKGKQIHSHIIRSSTKSPLLNVYIYNALIDIYCKCGDMRSARLLFESLTEKDIVSWNSMITGLAHNGLNGEAIETFGRMIEAKVRPNDITFLKVLSACRHTGLVDEGLRIFDMMGDHNLKPRSEHYAILIDLLGRKNRLNEAVKLMERAPGSPDHVGMWGALLGACRVHGDMDLARKAAEMLFLLEPSNSGRYVMLSNIYAASERWDDSRQVRRVMGDRGLRKETAFSWIEVKNMRHEFVANDTSHSHIEHIYEVIHGLMDQMREAGYNPCDQIGVEDDELCNYDLDTTNQTTLEVA